MNGEHPSFVEEKDGQKGIVGDEVGAGNERLSFSPEVAGSLTAFEEYP